MPRHTFRCTEIPIPASGPFPRGQVAFRPGGVGSVANVTYYDKVEVDLGVEAPFTTLAGFTAGLEAQGIGLLGQAGFFENFQVTFDLKTRAFHLDA